MYFHLFLGSCDQKFGKGKQQNKKNYITSDILFDFLQNNVKVLVMYYIYICR